MDLEDLVLIQRLVKKTASQKCPSRPNSTDFSRVTYIVSRRSNFKIWGLSDFTEKSYENHFHVQRPLAASIDLRGSKAFVL